MSQSVIGALRVNLGLDSAKFESGAKRVKDPLRAMKSQFRAVAAAASAMGAALSAAALKGAGEIDRAAKAARRLDASIGAFRALELAAGEAGVPLSAVTNDIQNIGREIANIGLSGNADRALTRLGLAASDLEGLDADAKVATIADAVKGLGLSAGEATAVLRDLGVRNREMALLMIQGGDAIRAARADVEDYGLALDAVEAGKIEAANDRIARLGLIARYAGQQLALQLVPNLGRAAQAMTEALREGGALRAVIDGLTGNLARISTWIGTAVAAFGIRYVGALAAARIATLTLAGSLVTLRGALIRSGIGIAVIAAGELVFRLGRLVTATGGFGAALAALKAVAAEVWDRIADGPHLVELAVRQMGWAIRADFLEAMADMQQSWSGFIGNVATLGAMIPGFGSSFRTLAASVAGTGDSMRALREEARLASTYATNYGTQVEGLFANMTRPLETLKALRETLAANDPGSLGGLGAGDGAEDGAGALGGIRAATDATGEAARTASDSFKGFFKDLVSGSGDAGDAVAKLADRMLDDLLDRALSPISDAMGSLFDGLISGMFGGAGGSGGTGTVTSIASLIAGAPGFARGTDSAPGGLAWVGEAGPELVNLPRGAQVIPNDRLGSLGGGGGVRMGDVHVSVAGSSASPEEIAEAVRQVTRDEARRVYARQRREGV
ncbi:hypothetical protein [Rhodovulum kholense]|uniref:Lambda family phage tail tape measure protein n=1 Tax=Rhodovulum kholense TaxID=453584 RepID=A0A8E2VGA7_9RHOB|nr:hypothetical protein [Rhodovulum kholense]PTW39248.1 hypothetical protein C8N38_12712 [Rhodovulum kholense]